MGLCASTGRGEVTAMQPVMPGKSTDVEVERDPAAGKDINCKGHEDAKEMKVNNDTKDDFSGRSAGSGKSKHSVRSNPADGLSQRMRRNHTGNPKRKSDVSMHSILLVRPFMPSCRNGYPTLCKDEYPLICARTF